MQFRLRRWVRGFMGLVRHRGLIGIHGSATVRVQGSFVFGKRVSVARNSLIQVPRNSSLILGDGVSIGRDVEISPSPEIIIGDFTSVQDRCIFLGHVRIGAQCLFAPNVLLSSGTHRFLEKPAWLIRDQDQLLNDPGYEPTTGRNLPIRVEDDCWIGINSVVMRGVTIGRGSVVGANSVVTKSIAPYSIVAGAPARLIRRRLSFVPPRAVSGVNPDDLPYFYSGFDLRQRTLAAFPTGVRACGRFQVALNCVDSRSIRIEIETDKPILLSYSAQRRELRAGSQAVSFTLESIPHDGLISLEVSDIDGRPCPATIQRISAEA
jgi:acetyltransferase-like isoleucine patch superfamily enzyme